MITKFSVRGYDFEYSPEEQTLSIIQDKSEFVIQDYVLVYSLYELKCLALDFLDRRKVHPKINEKTYKTICESLDSISCMLDVVKSEFDPDCGAEELAKAANQCFIDMKRLAKGLLNKSNQNV